MLEQEKKLNIDFGFLDEKKDSKPIRKSEVDLNVPVEKEAAASITEKKVKNVKRTNLTHPWLRYWARYLDIVLCGFGLGIILSSIGSSLLDMPEVILSIVVLFVWVFVESALLSSWGTTPGKWLLRIRIEGSKNKIDFSSSLNRSFSVWYKGLGFGIPIVSFFTLISSYNHLTKEGITPWDKTGGFNLSFQKIGFFRMLIAVVVSITFIIILFS